MKFDVCVIGSGAGGALVALGLQEQGASVAILEKGDWTKKNESEFFSFRSYYRDHGFVGSLGNAFIGIPTGIAVGGTTTINSGTCFETPPSVVQEWQKNLGVSIEHEELVPGFQRLRNILSIQPVSSERISEGNKLFRKGVEALGFEGCFPLERDEKNCKGSGRCPFVCPTSAKQSTDVSIIPTFLKKGGTLFPQTEVLHILEKKDRVILSCRPCHPSGGWDPGFKIECFRLIIAGGSLSSPILVRKNKIGSFWKKAGDELSSHPAVKVLARFPKVVSGWQGVPQAIGFKHPQFPKLSFEGVFTPPQLAGLVLPLDGQALDEWLYHYSHVASFGVFVKDSSRGQVRSYPLMGLFIKYNLDRDDFLNLVEGARFIGLAYLAAGAEKVVLPFNGIQNEFSHIESLKSFDFSSLKPSQLYSMGFHPLGTCGMGRVVDENLKVYGSERIFIADGSVVPSSLGVNPQITIMALALRLSKHLTCLSSRARRAW